MLAGGRQSKQATRQGELCHQRDREKGPRRITSMYSLMESRFTRQVQMSVRKATCSPPHPIPENALLLLLPHASRGPRELLPALQPSSRGGGSERSPYLGRGLHGRLQDSRLRVAGGLRGWRRPCRICLLTKHKQQGTNIRRCFCQQTVQVPALVKRKARAGSNSASSKVC